jgi:hypothetical protein
MGDSHVFWSFAYRGSLEVRVYDSLNRKVLITVALTVGVLAAFTMFLLLPTKGQGCRRPERRFASSAPQARSFSSTFLFGLEVRRRRFNLSEFDRVSLSQGFRAGYQVSLVGRDQELRSSLRRTWEPRVTAQKKLLRNVEQRSAISYKGSGGTV